MKTVFPASIFSCASLTVSRVRACGCMIDTRPHPPPRPTDTPYHKPWFRTNGSRPSGLPAMSP